VNKAKAIKELKLTQATRRSLPNIRPIKLPEKAVFELANKGADTMKHSAVTIEGIVIILLIAA